MEAGLARMTEKRSVFTGAVMGVRSPEDRAAAVALARERVPDATHFAVGLRGAATEEFFSDAGEPSGTAGRPLLELLRQRDVEHAILIVARRFGGIRLGRPGLLRAYREAGVLALEAARLEEPAVFLPVRLRLAYALYEIFRHQFPEVVDDPETVSFADTVLVQGRIAEADGTRLKAFVAAHGKPDELELGPPFFGARGPRNILAWPVDTT